jgi:hypothetical protein
VPLVLTNSLLLRRLRRLELPLQPRPLRTHLQYLLPPNRGCR